MEKTLLGVKAPKILLPAEGTDLSKWAVVACDQYTSQPEYWEEVERRVGNAPSTYWLTLPEAYLGGERGRAHAERICGTMREYVGNGVFSELPEGAVLVSRHLNGKVRTGLMLAFDLECYDYGAGSESMIRPTEGTVIERIRARLDLREGACIELPHILMLIDDPERTVIEPLKAAAAKRLYDFELMQNGGRITGDFIPAKTLESAFDALGALAAKLMDREKPGLMLYAAGDGNHSLGAAKAAWENRKKTLTPEQMENDPARYALAELVNVHDEGIVFEPIHRLVTGVDGGFLEGLVDALAEQNNCAAIALPYDTAAAREAAGKGAHVLPYVTKDSRGAIYVHKPVCDLPVATLDNALERMRAEVDYIHGEDALKSLASKDKAAGFLLEPMEKGKLFTTVLREGALPRKTFSMGEAHEKRYYLEARSL